MPLVSQYMTSHPRVVAPDTELGTVRALMHDEKIHHLPVVEGNVLVGILSDRDLVLMNESDDQVRDAMTTDVAQVHKGAPLDQVVALMRLEKFGSVVVVGPGGVEGIFTIADALHALSDALRQPDPGRL